MALHESRSKLGSHGPVQNLRKLPRGGRGAAETWEGLNERGAGRKRLRLTEGVACVAPEGRVAAKPPAASLPRGAPPELFHKRSRAPSGCWCLQGPRQGACESMSGGNGEGPSKKRQSGGAAIARLAGETSDNMKKPNDGEHPPFCQNASAESLLLCLLR